MTRRHPASVCSTSSDSDLDPSASDDFSDWSDHAALPCRSLFDERVLPSVEEALAYDAQTYGWELGKECARLGVDEYGRMRLINYIRREVGDAKLGLSGILDIELSDRGMRCDAECQARCAAVSDRQGSALRGRRAAQACAGG